MVRITNVGLIPDGGGDRMWLAQVKEDGLVVDAAYSPVQSAAERWLDECYPACIIVGAFIPGV